MGAPFDDSGGLYLAGSAYLFEIRDGSWVEVAKLVASDASHGAIFGFSIALEGERALVGAFRAGPGAAYVFERRGGAWVEVQKLIASVPQRGWSG